MNKELKFSIKNKLFLAVCLTAAICISLPLGFAYHLLKADLVADAHSSVLEKIRLSKRLYSKSYDSEIKGRVSFVSGMLGTEVGFISVDGKVEVVPAWSIGNNLSLNKAEILNAKDGNPGVSVINDSQDGEQMLAAIKVDKSVLSPAGYLVIHKSLSGLEERMGMILKVFFWALPIVALVCYGVIRFVTMQLTSSVESMVRTAEAVGQGNYKRRIRTFPDKEFLPLANSINWMAERIDDHVSIITGQKNKIQAVLNGMWDGVMVLDGNCRIQSVNRALSDVFPGIQNDIGRTPLEIVPSPDLYDACQELVSPEGPEAKAVQVVLPNGRVYDVNIVRSPHTSEPGQGPGAIAVFHDISEIKRLETVRQDFVANVSHELRTPLTSVKGYAETLLSDPPPPENVQKNFLATIEKNANHMCKIVDDLLNLSRLESGHEKVDLLPIDPSDVLREAWEACSGLAGKRNVELKRSFYKGDFSVEADSGQLMQLFRNLLENAIKYGPEDNPIYVEHEVVNGCLQLSVIDEGPGIPTADQTRIFERFYSVEKFRRNEFGSTGLGLAISRHIVSNHGGEIAVQCPPKGRRQGTAFVFSLSLLQADAVQKAV
ncbi:ATP-binding protein [Maridesulfovibrio sp.]|uniref:ATP-binding protein n=1 Tax=Maridesulfovibrio sp. TaxID=2795000 RepID=UPI003AFF6D13